MLVLFFFLGKGGYFFNEKEAVFPGDRAISVFVARHVFLLGLSVLAVPQNHLAQFCHDDSPRSSFLLCRPWKLSFNLYLTGLSKQPFCIL